MYSVVLMAALTTGVDMPDWGRRGGCCGCWGGGWGGCYGGCWGGCYGGYGWGGCYGGWGGGWGGWGGGYGGWGGGWGGWNYAAAPAVYTSPIVSPYATPMLASNVVTGSPTVSRSMYLDPGATANNRATIIVHLPAEARLIVDGKPTTSTSATRRFVSPPLEAGQSYHYIFKAEMDRDGQNVTTTKRVDVRPGERKEVSLNFTDLDQSAERKNDAAVPAERRRLPEKNKSPID